MDYITLLLGKFADWCVFTYIFNFTVRKLGFCHVLPNKTVYVRKGVKYHIVVNIEIWVITILGAICYILPIIFIFAVTPATAAGRGWFLSRKPNNHPCALSAPKSEKAYFWTKRRVLWMSFENIDRRNETQKVYINIWRAVVRLLRTYRTFWNCHGKRSYLIVTQVLVQEAIFLLTCLRESTLNLPIG